MNIEQTIRDYLPDILHMSLATSANNKPWVCEVHFSYDDALNLYFRSKPSRHSREIAQNPQVAGNIVTQHGITDAPRGVYFEGVAEMLIGVNEHHPAYQAVSKRFDNGPKILEEATQEDGHQFYKVTVSDFYVFDARKSKPSQKYHLKWPNI